MMTAALAYKEAARAGVHEAHTVLGLLLVREFQRTFDGAGYLLEASRLGEPNAVEFIEALKTSEQGGLAFERLREIVEEQPFEMRWPLLNEETTFCGF